MEFSNAGTATFRYVTALFVCLFFAATEVSAQQDRVTLSRHSISFSEFFSEIERQTGSVVMFDADDTALDRQVSLPLRQGSVAELLDATLRGAGYAWQKNGRYILVRPAEKSEPAPMATRRPRSPSDFERDVQAYTRYNIDRPTQTQRQQQPMARYDTIRTERTRDGVSTYPSRTTTPYPTGQTVGTPFARTTPPILAVKTNLVWWAARGTLNIGGETGLGKKTSLEIAGGLNRGNLDGSVEDNKKLAHWVVKPEFRYWLCERFNGHFFGVHALYGQYNVSGFDIPTLFDKEYRYEGDAYGAGIDYGYHLPLSKHWGLEFTAGVGVIRTDYSKYDCEKCGSEVGRLDKTSFGPTELGVKLVFMIK